MNNAKVIERLMEHIFQWSKKYLRQKEKKTEILFNSPKTTPRISIGSVPAEHD